LFLGKRDSPLKEIALGALPKAFDPSFPLTRGGPGSVGGF
jgi:hypothetical protein